MRLNPPTILIFLISLIFAVMAIVSKFGILPMPAYLPHQEFWLAITAYLTLMVGNIVNGL